MSEELRWYQPAFWLQFLVWTPLLVILTLMLLPMIKGAVEWVVACISVRSNRGSMTARAAASTTGA